MMNFPRKKMLLRLNFQSYAETEENFYILIFFLAKASRIPKSSGLNSIVYISKSHTNYMRPTENTICMHKSAGKNIAVIATTKKSIRLSLH